MMSNWEKRPLSEEQEEYAALDAYCLVEIMRELKKFDQPKPKVSQLDMQFGEELQRKCQTPRAPTSIKDIFPVFNPSFRNNNKLVAFLANKAVQTPRVVSILQNQNGYKKTTAPVKDSPNPDLNRFSRL